MLAKYQTWPLLLINLLLFFFVCWRATSFKRTVVISMVFAILATIWPARIWFYIKIQLTQLSLLIGDLLGIDGQKVDKVVGQMLTSRGSVSALPFLIFCI